RIFPLKVSSSITRNFQGSKPKELGDNLPISNIKFKSSSDTFLLLSNSLQANLNLCAFKISSFFLSILTLPLIIYIVYIPYYLKILRIYFKLNIFNNLKCLLVLKFINDIIKL